MHFRNVKQMTSYLMFDVYRFSNMILANEHRSLGPIFNTLPLQTNDNRGFCKIQAYQTCQIFHYSCSRIRNIA